MRFRQLVTGVAVACVLTLFGGVGRADTTVSLNISGQYSDLTTFSGSLVYDQTTQAFTAGSITDNTGLSAFSLTFNPETYVGANAYTITLPSGCVSGCNQFGAEFYTSSNPDSLPYLDLYFSGDPAAFAGGSIEPVQTYVGYFGPESNTSQEIIGEGLTRQVISGSLTPVSAVPEPASWFLLLAGFVLLTGGAGHRLFVACGRLRPSKESLR